MTLVDDITLQWQMLTALISWWAAGRMHLMICQKRGAGYGRCERDENSELIVLQGSPNVKMNCGKGTKEVARGGTNAGSGTADEDGVRRRKEKIWKGKRMVDGDRRRASASSAPSVINEEWTTICFPMELFPLQAQGSSSTNSHRICWDLLQTST